MNLTDYLVQNNPQHMPIVELQEGEFIRHNIINVGKDTFTLIEIPLLYKCFKVAGNYIQINNESRLKTQDTDGNPKSYSCFYI